MSIFKRRDVLEQSKVFKLSKVWHGKKSYYEIAYYSWGGDGNFGTSRDREVRAFFEPQTPKIPNSKWRFKNREVALKKYTWANLRWH